MGEEEQAGLNIEEKQEDWRELCMTNRRKERLPETVWDGGMEQAVAGSQSSYLSLPLSLPW